MRFVISSNQLKNEERTDQADLDDSTGQYYSATIAALRKDEPQRSLDETSNRCLDILEPRQT